MPKVFDGLLNDRPPLLFCQTPFPAVYADAPEGPASAANEAQIRSVGLQNEVGVPDGGSEVLLRLGEQLLAPLLSRFAQRDSAPPVAHRRGMPQRGATQARALWAVCWPPEGSSFGLQVICCHTKDRVQRGHVDVLLGGLVDPLGSRIGRKVLHGLARCPRGDDHGGCVSQ